MSAAARSVASEVTIEAVPDEAAETDFLGRVVREALAVVPVLDRGNLPARVEARLRRAGLSVRLRGRYTPRAEPRLGSPRRLDHVLVTDGVDAGLAGLGGAILGAEPVRLDSVVSPGASQVAPAPSSALLLVNCRAAKTSEVLEHASILSARGWRLGLIYDSDPIESRLAMICALLISDLPKLSSMALLSSQRSPAADVGAPAWLIDPAEVGAAELGAPRDLLIVSGHSNPQDALFGTEHALCSRAGIRHSTASVGPAFPCFSSGECFRQAAFGRDGRDATGLLDVRSVAARVLVLAGCQTAPLGDGWSDPDANLAVQLQHSDADAALVTACTSIERLELNLLLTALLYDGRSLGEAAHLVNRARRVVHLQASSLPGDLGPLLVLGNPELRFEAQPIRTMPVRSLPDGGFAVDLDGVSVDRVRGAFVRLDLEGATSLLLSVTRKPEDVWCRGAVVPGENGVSVYLFLGVPAGQPTTLAGAIEMLPGTDPAAGAVATLGAHLAQIPFWMIYLESFRQAAVERGESVEADALRESLALMAPFAQSLSLAATALRARPGVVGDGRRLEELCDAALIEASSLASVLLQCMILVSGRFGTMHSAGWEDHFERVDPIGPLDACMCGAQMWATRSRYLGNPGLERAEYQCARCGPIGEGDPRSLATLTECPDSCVRDSLLRCGVVCSAPAGERLHVSACLFVESLYADERRDAGAQVDTCVPAGESQVLDLRVWLPADLREGVRAIAVLAVVNGAATIFRQMINITAT